MIYLFIDDIHAQNAEGVKFFNCTRNTKFVEHAFCHPKYVVVVVALILLIYDSDAHGNWLCENALANCLIGKLRTQLNVFNFNFKLISDF